MRRQASLRDAYTARLNATSNLAQTYATIYAGNPVIYDEEVKDIIRKSRGHHRDYVVDLDDMTMDEVTKSSSTVRAQMRRYRAELKEMVEESKNMYDYEMQKHKRNDYQAVS